MRIKQHLKLVYLNLKQFKPVIFVFFIIIDIICPIMMCLWGQKFIPISNLIYKMLIPTASVLLPLIFLNTHKSNDANEILCFYKKIYIIELLIIFVIIQINMLILNAFYGMFVYAPILYETPIFVSVCLLHFSGAMLISAYSKTVLLPIGFSFAYSTLNIMQMGIPLFNYSVLWVSNYTSLTDTIFICMPFIIGSTLCLIAYNSRTKSKFI